MYNVRDMGWMIKSMSIHQMDSKEIIKFNFITSCLAFMGSIPTFMLVLLYIDGYALSFKTKIIINSDIWTWNLILNGLMYNIWETHLIYY